MTTYRLWPSTNGPATATANGGNFISGTVFCVTGEAWFQGYWWWVAGSGGQSTAATKCALWQIPYNNSAQNLVPGSVVTSGTLTAGQWNYIPLPTPLALSIGGSSGGSPAVVDPRAQGAQCAMYIAAITCNAGPFPDTPNYWGSGQAQPNGIVSGPLTAFSAQSAGMPSPYGVAQGVFSTAGTDPSATCPESQSGTDNFWVDVQVAGYSAAPAGASLRLWPNFPEPAVGENNDNTTAVSGTAFTLSEACTLDKIWMHSPVGSTGLASRTGIWNTDTQTEVSGTDNVSPSWKVPGGGAASAGQGWIYVDYSSAAVTLPAGHYAVSFYNGNALKLYYDTANVFFAGTDPVGGATVGGAAQNGVSWGGGILTAPNVANGPLLVYDDSSGTKPGQTMYTAGNVSWEYPLNFEASADWGENRWVDVEVTPISTTPNVPPYTASMSSM